MSLSYWLFTPSFNRILVAMHPLYKGLQYDTQGRYYLPQNITLRTIWLLDNPQYVPTSITNLGDLDAFATRTFGAVSLSGYCPNVVAMSDNSRYPGTGNCYKDIVADRPSIQPLATQVADTGVDPTIALHEFTTNIPLSDRGIWVNCKPFASIAPAFADINTQVNLEGNACVGDYIAACAGGTIYDPNNKLCVTSCPMGSAFNAALNRCDPVSNAIVHSWWIIVLFVAIVVGGMSGLYWLFMRL